VASLAIFEALSARAAKTQHEDTVEALGRGVVPHVLPEFSDIHLGLRQSTGLVLGAIARARRPNAVESTPSRADLELAAQSIVQARTLAGPAAVLDAVANGWRDFVAAGDVIRLPIKSPERLLRRTVQAMQMEAEYNAKYLNGSVNNAAEVALVEKLMARQAWEWLEDTELMPAAIQHAHRATSELYRWTLPGTQRVGKDHRFSVDDYVRASEAVHAAAFITDRVYRAGRIVDGTERLMRGTVQDWVGFVSRWGQVGEPQARAIIDWMTYDSNDARRDQGRLPFSATPLFDVGDDQRMLAPTARIWQKPEWALRAIWKARQPQSYGAELAGLGHKFAEEISTVFAQRGWHLVVEKKYSNGDIDVGLLDSDGRLAIAIEAKMYLDDPVHQIEDSAVWRQVHKNLEALRRPEDFERVFGPGAKTPNLVVGLLVIPGRAGPSIEVASDISVVGSDDLRDLVAKSKSVEELWRRVKSTETKPTGMLLATEEIRFGRWTLEVDVLSPQSIPRVLTTSSF